MNMKLIWAVAAVLLRIWRKSRPAAVLSAVVVIAIGFIYRRRQRKLQTADMPAPLARPTTGTSTVGVVGEQATATMHLRPATPSTPRRDEPEKS